MDKLDFLRSPKILEKLWLACSEKTMSARVGAGMIVYGRYVVDWHDWVTVKVYGLMSGQFSICSFLSRCITWR